MARDTLPQTTGPQNTGPEGSGPGALPAAVLTPRRLLVPLVAVGLAAVAAAVALPARSAGSAAAVAAGPACARTLRVVTAASYAPVLAGVAPGLADGPDCVGLDVTVADGRGAAARVPGTGADVWIPDDASWAGNPEGAKLAAAPAAGAGTVLATSPVHLVTDRDTAHRLAGAGGGWLALAHLATQHPAGARPVVRDPGGSGDGMLGAGSVGESVWIAAGMDAAAEALTTALPATRTVTGDGPALPTAPGEVGLVPERALIPVADRVARAGSVVLAPGDRTALLRYSWLPTAAAAADPARAAALDRLARALTGPAADGPLAAAHLRRPGGGPPPGAPAGLLPAVTAPPYDVLGPHHVDHVLAVWYPADRRSDVLVAVDVSGSMEAREPGTTRSLMDVVKDGVGALARLLPDDSRLGLWRFGSRLDGTQDYQALLGATALDGRGRAVVAGAVGRLRPTETGTGLHDTILAAYLAARDTARPGVPSHVVVFTDGHNEADVPTLTREELGRRLTAAKDPARPVAVTVVAFGRRADAPALEAALKPVDGDVDAVDHPDEVDAAFIHIVAGGIHG
jgi:hypothetical protein